MLESTMTIGIAVKTRNAVVRRLRWRSGYSTANETGCASFMPDPLWFCGVPRAYARVP
jgi:hypothetical protein